MQSDRHSRNGFLCRKGLEEAAQRFSLEGLAPRGDNAYLDSKGSVSGLRRDEIMEDIAYDEKHIELNLELVHNGS